jgi:hypothetical protein
MDVHATLAEAMGASPAQCSPHGRSFLPALTGGTWQGRDCALYGTFGSGAVVTDDQYTYASSFDPGKPPHRYSTYLGRCVKTAQAGLFLPGVDCMVWRHPAPSNQAWPASLGRLPMLFDRREDPDQNDNLAGKNAEAESRMRDKLRRQLQELQAPPEQFERLGLV